MWHVPQGPDDSSRLRIFISYARKDATWAADHLFARCCEPGYEVWLDRQHLRGGQQLRPAIQAALDRTDVVLAILTPHSYGSVFCNLEREYAATSRKYVIPVTLDEKSEVPYDLAGANARLVPTQIDDILVDLAILASHVTPDQLGPGLSRLSPAIQSQLPPSMLFDRKETTSGVVQLISEISTLASLLAPLYKCDRRTPLHAQDESMLALKLVQGFLPRAVAHVRMREHDVSSLLRRLGRRSDQIDGTLLKGLADHINASTFLITENRQFAEHRERMFGDSGVSVVYSILTMNRLHLNQLPTFEHRGLDAATSVLKCVGAEDELVADAMLNILVSKHDANTKTIVAHLARRFHPFRDRVGNDWEKLVRRAVKMTDGTDQDRLDVEHNVVYAGAMHGSRFCFDNIMTIEGDAVRREAIIAFNRKIVSEANFGQILKMLNRKATNPQLDEAWVSPWAGRLFNILRG